MDSGVTIGRARRAVHAGPALSGAQNLPDAVFKKFFGEEGALLEYLHAGPLQPCYAQWISVFLSTTNGSSGKEHHTIYTV